MSRSSTHFGLLGLCAALAACSTTQPESRRPSVSRWIAEGVHDETLDASRAPSASTEANTDVDAAAEVTGTGSGADTTAGGTLEVTELDPLTIGTLDGDERTISLLEVLELVETQGIDVQLADERLREARAETYIAEAAWWPQLRIGTSLYRNEGRVQSTPGAFIDTDKQNAYAGGQLRMEFDFGDAIYGARAARHSEQASSFETDSAVHDAVTFAALAYFDLLESYARLPIAEDALQHAEELVTFEQARLDGGSGLESDLARARSHRAVVQRAAIQARTQARVASSLLLDLLQLDSSELLAPDADALGSLDLIDPLLAPDGDTVNPSAMEHALRGHPGLLSANSRVAASEAAETEAENAWMLPKVILGAQFGGLGLNYSDLESQDVYTAAVSWDLGAHLAGEKDRSRSRRRQAELRRARLRSSIRSSVQIATAQLESARLSIDATELEVQAAESARDLARSKHARGAALLIEVLDSQVALLRARVARTAAVADYNRAQFNYLRSAGLFDRGIVWME